MKRGFFLAVLFLLGCQGLSEFLSPRQRVQREAEETLLKNFDEEWKNFQIASKKAANFTPKVNSLEEFQQSYKIYYKPYHHLSFLLRYSQGSFSHMKTINHQSVEVKINKREFFLKKRPREMQQLKEEREKAAQALARCFAQAVKARKIRHYALPFALVGYSYPLQKAALPLSSFIPQSCQDYTQYLREQCQGEEGFATLVENTGEGIIYISHIPFSPDALLTFSSFKKLPRKIYFLCYTPNTLSSYQKGEKHRWVLHLRLIEQFEEFRPFLYREKQGGCILEPEVKTVQPKVLLGYTTKSRLRRALRKKWKNSPPLPRWVALQATLVSQYIRGYEKVYTRGGSRLEPIWQYETIAKGALVLEVK